MNHPLDGCNRKIKRANLHLKALKATQDEFFLRSELYRIVEDRESEPPWVKHILNVTRDFPADWSLIVGDAIHNLRSALDHLVWSLVLANDGEPGGWNQFPIFSFPFRKSRRRSPTAGAIRSYLQGVHPEHIALIKELQPYQARYPERHPLSVLSYLSNIDKHRTLHPVLVVQTLEIPFRIQVVRGTLADLEGFTAILNPFPPKDGAEVARLFFPPGSQLVVNVESELSFSPAFGERPVSMPEIWFIRSYVRSVVEGFASLLR